ncbi:hypothetical protein ACSBR2_023328 [Camellia fascicularis]
MANLGSSSELNMDNRKKEIRQGKQKSCTTATSFQKSEQESPAAPGLLNKLKETLRLSLKNHQIVMEEEGENYPTEKHILNMHRVLLMLVPDKEVLYLVTTEWWIEGAKLRIQPWRQIEASQEWHFIALTPTLSMEDNQSKAKGILGLGADNKKFRRNMRELV